VRHGSCLGAINAVDTTHVPSVQVSSQQSPGLPVRAVHAGRPSRRTTAPSFGQPPSIRRANNTARHVRPSCVRRGWADRLERTRQRSAWSRSQHRQLRSPIEDALVSTVFGALSALEATMRYTKWHWHWHFAFMYVGHWLTDLFYNTESTLYDIPHLRQVQQNRPMHIKIVRSDEIPCIRDWCTWGAVTSLNCAWNHAAMLYGYLT